MILKLGINNLVAYTIGSKELINLHQLFYVSYGNNNRKWLLKTLQ